MAETYLGEFPVNIKKSPFADYTPADWALYFIGSYGQIDGAHHKQWVLDQAARILHGTPIKVVEARWTDHEPEYRVTLKAPSKAYKKWVKEMKGENENGDPEYDYDEGIAP